MKNSFYIIRKESEPKIIGVKDGLSQVEIVRDGFLNKSYYDQYINYFHSTDLNQNFEHSKEFPPFTINLEYLKMRDKGKLTDFMAFRPVLISGKYLISDHVTRLLSTFKLPNYRLYPVVIDDRGKIIKDYKLLYIIPLDKSSVCNVVKSIFFTGLFYEDKNKLTFKNEQEYLEYSKEKSFKAKKLVLNKSFDQDLDYFDIRGEGSFISKELKETFEIAGITGVKFIEAKEPELVFEEQN